MRIAALDVGEKRIGMALTDPSGMLTQPFEVLERKGTGADVARIFQFVRDNDVAILVFGLPYDDEGRPTPMAKKILELKDKVAGLLKRKNFKGVSIETWDETMTTHEAHEKLKEAGVKHSKRKEIIDKVAAVMILESYLQAHPRGAK
ncbi:MAG: Holliday junction resolvase RuvX [Deltaproteobacteria bacterium]|nr:Holliday junction resolvase RuvX [Deltaproteobacteria bacterium]MBI2342700.1 Holliday junction resolvase RuvX [Deltaproteobacteria bacterium]